MADYLASSQLHAGETTRFSHTATQADLDLSEEESFRAPPGADGLFDKFKQLNGARQPSFSTPRAALARKRNPNAKNEFTPMLKSATANRTRQVNGLLKGGLETPAALKPGFDLGGTPLPEASITDAMNSSSISESGVDGRTPGPDALSSSDLSTPMALPKRGQEALDGNGNVLTLREQEAVSAWKSFSLCLTSGVSH
jgi:hypothetical protein